MLAAVLARYDHAHDLAALPCTPRVPITDTDCPHTWAQRVYQGLYHEGLLSAGSVLDTLAAGCGRAGGAAG
jgi:hypothetical protein